MFLEILNFFLVNFNIWGIKLLMVTEEIKIINMLTQERWNQYKNEGK